MNLETIVLIITPIIVFIKDQKREFKQKDISALVLTGITIKANPNIWKLLEQKEYLVIFASSEIDLAPQFHS